MDISCKTKQREAEVVAEVALHRPRGAYMYVQYLPISGRHKLNGYELSVSTNARKKRAYVRHYIYVPQLQKRNMHERRAGLIRIVAGVQLGVIYNRANKLHVLRYAYPL